MDTPDYCGRPRSRRPRPPAPIGDGLAQKLQQRALLFRQAGADDRRTLVLLPQHLERPSIHVLVEQAWADVGRAADGRGVAELFGRDLNGQLDLSLALGLARTLTLESEGDRAEESARPGTEIF